MVRFAGLCNVIRRPLVPWGFLALKIFCNVKVQMTDIWGRKAAIASLSPQEEAMCLNPGVHSFRQRPATGTEIA
jgi:hypothetical protein